MTTNFCIVCFAPDARYICKAYRSVRYCSKECQRADWRNGHRDRCRLDYEWDSSLVCLIHRSFKNCCMACGQIPTRSPDEVLPCKTCYARLYCSAKCRNRHALRHTWSCSDLQIQGQIWFAATRPSVAPILDQTEHSATNILLTRTYFGEAAEGLVAFEYFAFPSSYCFSQVGFERAWKHPQRRLSLYQVLILLRYSGFNCSVPMPHPSVESIQSLYHILAVMVRSHCLPLDSSTWKCPSLHGQSVGQEGAQPGPIKADTDTAMRNDLYTGHSQAYCLFEHLIALASQHAWPHLGEFLCEDLAQCVLDYAIGARVRHWIRTSACKCSPTAGELNPQTGQVRQFQSVAVPGVFCTKCVPSASGYVCDWIEWDVVQFETSSNPQYVRYLRSAFCSRITIPITIPIQLQGTEEKHDIKQIPFYSYVGTWVPGLYSDRDIDTWTS